MLQYGDIIFATCRGWLIFHKFAAVALYGCGVNLPVRLDIKAIAALRKLERGACSVRKVNAAILAIDGTARKWRRRDIVASLI